MESVPRLRNSANHPSATQSRTLGLQFATMARCTFALTGIEHMPSSETEFIAQLTGGKESTGVEFKAGGPLDSRTVT